MLSWLKNLRYKRVFLDLTDEREIFHYEWEGPVAASIDAEESADLHEFEPLGG